MNVQDSGDSPEILSDSMARIAVLEAELKTKEEELQRTIAEPGHVKAKLRSKSVERPEDLTDLPERTNRLARVGG